MEPTKADEASQPKPTTYEVTVGNLGTVHSGADEAEARAVFAHYCEASKSERSRASGESVALFEAGELREEFIGALDFDEDQEQASAAQLAEAVESEERTVALFESATKAEYNTLEERAKYSRLASETLPKLERLRARLRARTISDEAEAVRDSLPSCEDGELRRGVWRLEDGTLGYHGSGASHYEARRDCEAVRSELDSLAGSRIECADGTYLYAMVGSEDEASESEHSASVLAAVEELRSAGFEVCGDYEALPLLWRVSQGLEQGYPRFRTASEDEAREVFAQVCESVGAGLDRLASVTLEHDRADGSREIVETYHRDEAQASLFEAVPKLRGSVFEVEAEDLQGFSDLDYSRLNRETRSQDSRAEAIRNGTARFVFVTEFATGSDYGGSGALSKANLRDLLDLCKSEGLTCSEDYWELSGAYASFGIAFRLGLRNSALVETLQGLEDYPAISDETMSEVESEEESEAWENCYRSDFRRELESAQEVDLSETPDEELFELFRKACDSSNSYWEHDSSGASIRLERVCEDITRAEVFALTNCKREVGRGEYRPLPSELPKP